MKFVINKIFTNKVLVKNFTSLSLLQFTNYLFPLITFPYLVRVLGPDKYGLINFAGAFTGYFIIITDYGFNLSATQQISINRNDKEKINKIFSDVLSAKIILFFLSGLIFFFCLFAFDLFKNDLPVYLVSFAGLFGSVLFPLWFFQGIEKMNFIFIINFVIKLMTIISVFLFIKFSSDYLLLVAFYSTGQIIYGFGGLVWIWRKFGIKFSFPSYTDVFIQIKKGKNYFVSSFGINALTNSNIFILGLFADKSVVGYFAAADKIRLALQSLLTTYFTATFPYVSNLAKQSLRGFYSFNKKSFILTLIFGAVIFILIFSGSALISEIILGGNYRNSIDILRVIAIVPLLYGISNFLGVQILLPLNLSKKYAEIMIYTLFLYLIASLFLTAEFKAIGSAAAIIITEIFLIILLSTQVRLCNK